MTYDAAHQEHVKFLKEQYTQQELQLIETKVRLAELEASVAYWKKMIQSVASGESELELLNGVLKEDPVLVQHPEFPPEATATPCLSTSSVDGDSEPRQAYVPVTLNEGQDECQTTSNAHDEDKGSENQYQESWEDSSYTDKSIGFYDSPISPPLPFKATSDEQDEEDENEFSYFEDQGNENSQEECVGDKRNPRDMLLSQFIPMTLAEAIEGVLGEYNRPVTPEQVAKKMLQPQLAEDDFKRARHSLASEMRRGAKDGKWKKYGRGLFVVNK